MCSGGQGLPQAAATFAATVPPAVAAAEWRAQRLDRAESGRAASRTCLPIRAITLPTLRLLRSSWGVGSGSRQDPDDVKLWVTCFFGIFRAGELTVQSQTAFDPRVHLVSHAKVVNTPPGFTYFLSFRKPVTA